ncbi:MAG: serine hydrolase [Syntrophaceae bacterium]|nr:serine hydrolase [Syntrophaceae bacterium]
MESRLFKGIWVGAVILALLVAVFPDQIFSKTRKTFQTKPQRAETQQAPRLVQAAQGGIWCDAQSAILMDGLTGQILYEQNPYLRIPPASFVKVLTLYLAYDALRAGQIKMDDWVTVSEKAWRTQGSKMFIKVGSRVKVEDLLKGIAVTSGNDACVAIAEHLAGSEEVFVLKMNEKARALGLKDSQIKNSHGMPAEGQYTTAMDMALLAQRYIEEYPEALALHSMTEFEYNGIRQGNRNTLLQKNIGVDGLKTGHVEESGYHLLATAKRDGQRMIAVVMGCDRMRKRAPEAEKLLEYGFRNFSTVEAVKKGDSFGPVKVRRGNLNQVVLTAAEPGRVTVARGKESAVTIDPKLPAFLVAPVQKGQLVARVLIQNEGKVLREVKLVSSAEVLKSILPPWPVILAGIVGIVLIGLFGFWWFRRPKPRKF